jgi:hypothetical protein
MSHHYIMSLKAAVLLVLYFCIMQYTLHIACTSHVQPTPLCVESNGNNILLPKALTACYFELFVNEGNHSSLLCLSISKIHDRVVKRRAANM